MVFSSDISAKVSNWKQVMVMLGEPMSQRKSFSGFQPALICLMFDTPDLDYHGRTRATLRKRNMSLRWGARKWEVGPAEQLTEAS